ncbi:hypothetical protein [Mucilaginibacter lappiensis]|uniref:Zinc-finger n=1 Tax=Mucilaginibacter lappiensis TaxID=354630 RepID=A0A1N6S4G7_9SPHI|nr:hypothetical protein [Mucilaginibacter lappiensis]MBB6108494.1 hypothetical protein [Mucilaginibacter lappiensis]MBB6131594.1 hypothetical protein [Mucilaginibacter lappiensis]SIQ35856.1 hypothetical protein SAMN05421821_102270 [Mucilaginibacter lappiensis]
MNPLKKVIYNCKQATLLIEKRQIRKLSFRESIELRIHLAGCSMCKLYNKQSQIINQMVLQLFHDTELQVSTLSLDENFKKELQDRIEGELNK